MYHTNFCYTSYTLQVFKKSNFVVMRPIFFNYFYYKCPFCWTAEKSLGHFMVSSPSTVVSKFWRFITGHGEGVQGVGRECEHHCSWLSIFADLCWNALACVSKDPRSDSFLADFLLEAYDYSQLDKAWSFSQLCKHCSEASTSCWGEAAYYALVLDMSVWRHQVDIFTPSSYWLSRFSRKREHGSFCIWILWAFWDHFLLDWAWNMAGGNVPSVRKPESYSKHYSSNSHFFNSGEHFRIRPEGICCFPSPIIWETFTFETQTLRKLPFSLFCVDNHYLWTPNMQNSNCGLSKSQGAINWLTSVDISKLFSFTIVCICFVCILECKI